MSCGFIGFCLSISVLVLVSTLLVLIDRSMILARIAKPPSVNIPLVNSNCPKIIGPKKPPKRPKAFTMAIPAGAVSTVKKEGKEGKENTGETV